MAIVLIKQIWIIVNSVNNVLHCSKENKHKASDNSEINDAGLNEKTCGENQSRAPPPAVKCVHCESPRDKQNDGNKHSLPQLLVSFRLSPIDLLKTSKCAFSDKSFNTTLCYWVGRERFGSMAGRILGTNRTTLDIEGQPRRGQGRSGRFHYCILVPTCCVDGNANPTCAVDQSKFEIADGNTTVSWEVLNGSGNRGVR